MTKREFIKKSIFGMVGLMFFSSIQNLNNRLEHKKHTPKKQSNPKSDPFGANMAFGHSLPHSEFI